MNIELFNRDGADLKLKKVGNIAPKVGIWRLVVDDAHKYCLEYVRVIYSNGVGSNIDSVDPSGGPFISVGDEFENKYKIIDIINCTTFKIRERD